MPVRPGAVGQQGVLRGGVAGGGVRLAGFLVVEVAAGDGGRGVVADREPGLGDRRQGQVVRRAGPAHPGWRPARLHGVGQHSRPVPGHRERQHGVVQLAVAVGLRPVPGAMGPQRVIQEGITAAVHARAEVDEPGGRRDQRGEQIGREHVDREHVGQPVGGLDPAGLPVADAGVVDHGVVAAPVVGLAGHRPHPGDAGQVADDQRRGAGLGPADVIGRAGERACSVTSWPSSSSSRAAISPSPSAEPVIRT